MAKDYEDLCTDVVVPHLHQLVDTIDADHLQKVLVHEWVLGIENNWAAYHNATSHDSTFVARLTFWIHGLRDKFLRCESDRQAVALLNEVFDASTYGCLEYGGSEAMAMKIEGFCRAADGWMEKRVLQPRWEAFSIIRKTGPLINQMLEIVNDVQDNDRGEHPSMESELRRRLLAKEAPEHDVVEGISRLMAEVYDVGDQFLRSHPEYSDVIFASLDKILWTVEASSVGDPKLLDGIRRRLTTAKKVRVVSINCVTWYGRPRPNLTLFVHDGKAKEQSVTTRTDGTALLRLRVGQEVTIRPGKSGRDVSLLLTMVFTNVELRLWPFGFVRATLTPPVLVDRSRSSDMERALS